MKSTEVSTSPTALSTSNGTGWSVSSVGRQVILRFRKLWTLRLLNGAALEALRKDRERLDWLIDRGFTPAKWRNPDNRWEYEHLTGSNHMVFEGRGGREEIDQAMERAKANVRVD